MVDITYENLPAGIPADTDIFPTQKPGGVTQKYTLDDIRIAMRAAAEAHSSADYTMLAVTSTPEKLNGYDAADTAVGITATLVPTAGSNTASFVINADKDGVYRVTFNIEVESNTNESIDFVLNVNGFPTEFKTGIDLNNAATDRGNAGINTFLTVVATDVIEMYINTDGSNMDILIDSLTFTAQRI